MNRAKFQ